MNKIGLRLCALLLLVATVLSALAACGEDAAVTTATPETDPPHYTDLPYTDEPGALSICGAPISEYRVVIPQKSDLYTQYAAKNLVDYVKYNLGITLSVVTDATDARERELLIGGTNREGSLIAAETELAAEEFILMRHGESVVIYGESYMVGGAASKLLNVCAGPAWRGLDVDITDLPTEPIPERFEFREAKNAVYLIGDGFGENHIYAALAGGLEDFCGLDMPNRGTAVTASLSVIEKKASATDSAAGGTALATGYKTYNGYVGVDGEGIPLVSLRELAHASGAKTSLLTTDPKHATTISAFLVHTVDRDRTEEILMMQEAVEESGEVTLVRASVGRAIVSEAAHHLYTVSSHGSTFFSMIEEGDIDSASHDNDMKEVTRTVTQFNSLIAYCMEFVIFHPDTVLVITADHETGSIRPIPNSGGYSFGSKSHTNVDVPVFAMGWGTEYFDGERVDNTNIAKFIAKIYGDDKFGQPTE